MNVREGTLGLSPEDEAIVASMNRASGNFEERKTLADIIMGKIAEKEAEQRGNSYEEEDDDLPPLPEKVVDRRGALRLARRLTCSFVGVHKYKVLAHQSALRASSSDL